MECAKLKAILDINRAVVQRNIDGTVQLVDGNPVSAAMTLAAWPEDALAGLLDATNDFMASLAGPANASEKTPAQADFTAVSTALAKCAAGIGATKFAPGTLPPKTGFAASQDCALVR